jgi:hypothetical protein
MNTTRQTGNLRALLLMGGVLFLVHVAFKAGRKLMNGVPLPQLPFQLIPPATLWILVVLVFVPGFLLVERAASSRGRAGPYTVVVLIGCALVAALFLPTLSLLGFPTPGALSSPHSSVPLQLQVFLDVLLRMGLAAFIYAGYSERLEAAQALQALETRRNEMMGRLAASRLEAARTRVQPEAFIAELHALRDAYAEDPVAGGAGLEALITRLRAASQSTAT